METSLEKKKAEAVERMRALKMSPDAINSFANHGIVMVSERPWGALYELDESVKKIVSDFEKEYNSIVYTVVHTFTEFGELYDLLYVCDTEDEWELDREDLKEFYTISGCYNATDNFLEIGSILVKPVFGGLIRVE